MRHDDLLSTFCPPSTSSDPPPSLSAQSKAWLGGLVVLVLLTSVAVASVSVWLVPPYLGLMVWILGPTWMRRDTADVPSGSEAHQAPSPVATALADDSSREALSEPPPDLDASERQAPDLAGAEGQERLATDGPLVKTKRGKGRGKKAKASAVSEPVSATWIRVGPGKFIRADGPTATTLSEPGPPVTPEPVSSVAAPAPAEAPTCSDADALVPEQAAEAPPESDGALRAGGDLDEGRDRDGWAPSEVLAGEPTFETPGAWSEAALAAEELRADAVAEPMEPDSIAPVDDDLSEDRAWQEPVRDEVSEDELAPEPTGALSEAAFVAQADRAEWPGDTTLEPDVDAGIAASIASETDSVQASFSQLDDRARFDGLVGEGPAPDDPATQCEADGLDVQRVASVLGDNGIALDAPSAGAVVADVEPSAFAVAECVDLGALEEPPQSWPPALPIARWKGSRPRIGMIAERVVRAVSLRPARGTRRASRKVPGVRSRSPRGAGRFRLIGRMFPPRSPPRLARWSTWFPRGRAAPDAASSPMPAPTGPPSRLLRAGDLLQSSGRPWCFPTLGLSSQP